MRASFHTFGCKLNQYETEALASMFRRRGFSLVSQAQEAELFVINTCTVTSKSEQKARRLIRGLSRRYPEALLVVTGCYAQLNGSDLAGLGSNVYVIPQERKAELLELPERIGSGGEGIRAVLEKFSAAPRSSASADPFRFQVDNFSYHSRAFLKVQDGCDYHCTYCRVPLARGSSVSLDPEEVLRRALLIERNGYREVVLTGVNLTDYHYNSTELPNLLALLLSGTKRIRLRLSSLEPERITPDLTEIFRRQRICPHFHIPVQSASNSVLLRMKRRYRSAQVVQAVRLLREVKEDPFLAADVIAGFPGESEEDFLETYSLVEELDLSKLHVFPFSPRPATAAFDFKDHVPERIRDERVHRLIALSQRSHVRYMQRWLGREVRVVLERRSGEAGEQSWQGLSENYLKVTVQNLPEEQARAGNLVRARIGEAGNPCRGRYLGD